MNLHHVSGFVCTTTRRRTDTAGDMHIHEVTQLDPSQSASCDMQCRLHEVLAPSLPDSSI